MKKHDDVSRRDFARVATIAAATVVIAPGAMAQQGKPERHEPATPIKPPDYEKEMTASTRAEAESKYQWVLQRYGDRLDAAQRAEVRKSIYGMQKSLQAIRDFAIENGDEPATRLYLGAHAHSEGAR